jgi:hypothetical protein
MADHRRRFAMAFGLLTALSPLSAAAAQFSHVRSDDATIRSFLMDGYERSTTLQVLVNEIESRSGIVYIEPMVKLSQGMDGALLHFVAGPADLRILRVVIRTNLSRDYAIAIAAHELQHVLEALRSGRVTSADAMARFFRSLVCGSPTRKYETEAARVIAEQVLADLRKAPRR